MRASRFFASQIASLEAVFDLAARRQHGTIAQILARLVRRVADAPAAAEKNIGNQQRTLVEHAARRGGRNDAGADDVEPSGLDQHAHRLVVPERHADHAVDANIRSSHRGPPDERQDCARAGPKCKTRENFGRRRRFHFHPLVVSVMATDPDATPNPVTRLELKDAYRTSKGNVVSTYGLRG